MKRAIVLLVSALASNLAGAVAIQAHELPTLDEGGLVALVAVVGIVGAIIVRRRKR